VAKKRTVDERTRLLRSLRRRQFDRFRFIGSDALVARVRESAPVPGPVKAKIDESLPSRWYPVGDGYLVKWQHDRSGVTSEDFSVEAGGWDHEHCDACNRTVDVGDTVWVTVRGSFYKLCPYCYRQVAQISRARTGLG
jgi:hypothetical protein